MKICIVSHFGYSALTGKPGGHIGGVEWQTSLLARWLAERGHEVSLLTWQMGERKEEIVGGVRIIKMCKQSDGLPLVRFFHPRWSSLTEAMGVANAELYYQNCAEYVTGQVCIWCKWHRRRFVYSVASDPDCDPELPKMKSLRERLLYRIGVRKADRIIVQTATQKRMLMEGWRLDSEVLPMPCPGPSDEEYKAPLPPTKDRFMVLYVGRIAREKRLDILLDVAEMLNYIRFEIAGAPDIDDSYSRAILNRAGRMPNVNLHGLIPREKMSEIYKKASLLICTSAYEGFPNTFLEAWSHGIPVVSSIDIDGIIRQEGLGIVNNSASELARSIVRIIDKPEVWKQFSANARAHYEKKHRPEVTLPEFERLFDSVLKKAYTKN